jgi:hypothetical protein
MKMSDKSNIQTIILNHDYDPAPENYTGIIICSNGTKAWYKNGKLHREDGVRLLNTMTAPKNGMLMDNMIE